MNLQPAKTHILCRFHNPEKPTIKLVGQTYTGGDQYRTRVEVLAVGPKVEACKNGDFLLLIPKPTVLGVGDDETLGLIDEASVLGVTDDEAPLTIHG
jgi:hypothetical protein